jgi:cyclase
MIKLMTRTHCSIGLLALLAGAYILRAQQPAPDDIFTVVKLADRVYMLSTASEGGVNGEALGNVLFFVSGEGVVVVDDQFDKQRRSGRTVDIAQGILAQIRKVTNEPIRYVINTHHHADHAGGDLTFGKIAPIVAQANLRRNVITQRDGILTRAPAQIARTQADLATAEQSRDTTRIAQLREQLARQNLQLELAKSPDFETTLPGLTYETEMQIHLGGEEIRLYHFGPAHTDGDSLVYFTKANIAHWGDTFETESNPAIISSGGASTRGWIAFLTEGLKATNTKTKMIPGHGHVGTAADVEAMRQYFVNLRGAAEGQIRAGKTRDEAVEAIAGQFPQYRNYRPGMERYRSNIGTIYDEVKGNTAK